MTHGLVWASRTLGRPRVLHQRLTAPLRNATAQVLAAPKLARQPCRLATRTLITTAHRQSLHRSPLKYMGQPTSETHPHLVQAGHITPGITSDEYAQRRARLAEALPENSVVIVFGHPLSFKATHVFYPFRQQSDFFYLTGFNEPDAVLLIEKGAHSGSAVTSTLFVPPQDDASERWEGPRAGIDGVRSYFGDYEAYPIKELEQVLQRVLARRPGSVQRASSQTDGSAVVSLSSLVSNLRSRPETSATDSLQVYADIPLNYTLRSSQHVVHSVLKHRGLVPINISPFIQNLRVYKSAAEVAVMQRCSDLTADAFRSTIQRTKDCTTEHEVCSLFEYECRRRGAEELAYVPVVAAGENALSMHYVLNNQVLRRGDMLLLDGGASWSYYASDVTRTWPLFGQPFSTPQAELYQAVLNTQKACIALCTEDAQISLNQVHWHSVATMKEELLKIGWEVAQQDLESVLYPHHVGHYLGLDVHDTMDVSRNLTLKDGMVVTIEPGLYVPFDDRFPSRYQGIGIRIEDNIVVRRSAPLNLSKQVPKEIVDIEALVKP